MLAAGPASRRCIADRRAAGHRGGALDPDAATPYVAAGTMGATPADDFAPRAARRRLFLVFLIALPLPYWFVETGRAPALWIAAVAALTAGAALHDGGPMAALIAKLVVPQAVGWVLATWLAAWAVTAVVGRAVPAGRRRGVVRALLVAALVLALCPVFRTSAAHGGAATNVLGVFRLA